MHGDRESLGKKPALRRNINGCRNRVAGCSSCQVLRGLGSRRVGEGWADLCCVLTVHAAALSFWPQPAALRIGVDCWPTTSCVPPAGMASQLDEGHGATPPPSQQTIAPPFPPPASPPPADTATTVAPVTVPTPPPRYEDLRFHDGIAAAGGSGSAPRARPNRVGDVLSDDDEEHDAGHALTQLEGGELAFHGGDATDSDLDDESRPIIAGHRRGRYCTWRYRLSLCAWQCSLWGNADSLAALAAQASSQCRARDVTTGLLRIFRCSMRRFCSARVLCVGV